MEMLNIEVCIPIINVIKGLVIEVGNSAFLETAELLSNNQTIQNGDNIHFARLSLHGLGEKYFNAFIKIL